MALITFLSPIPEQTAEGESQETKVSLLRRPEVLELWQIWGFLKAHLDQAHPRPGSLFFELTWIRDELSESLLVRCFSNTRRGVTERSPPQSSIFRAQHEH